MNWPQRCPVRRARVGDPRRGLVIDEAYKAWIRKQPCVCCGTRRFVECAHVGLRGLGQRCSDYRTLPLCSAHHVQGPQSHHFLQKRFWAAWGFSREKLIAGFNRKYQQETGRRIAA